MNPYSSERILQRFTFSLQRLEKKIDTITNQASMTYIIIDETRKNKGIDDERGKNGLGNDLGMEQV